MSIINGTSNSDSLQGSEADDTLIGGLGNDTVDGGAGMNVYQVHGSPDGFYWSVNSTGDVLLTDALVDPDDPLDGSDEGVTVLRNIQTIQFLSPDLSVNGSTLIDDYSNAPSTSNVAINYGVWVNGRTNFFGDTDYFKLNTVAGQKVAVNMGSNASWGYLTDDGNQYQLDGTWADINPWDTKHWTWATTGTRDVHFEAYDMSSSSPMSSKGYSFILRREWSGTDQGDSVSAGTDFEYLDGGLGDDTLVGSARSDKLLGGDGNDVLTGGGGADEIDGGAGTANVAIFSGNRAEYAATWAWWGLTLTDRVANRDGTDQLRNVQILRFADGDVVLDAESNVPVRSGALDLGAAIHGSLPIGGSDEDYFLQKFPSSVTADTALRLTLSTSAASDSYGSLRVQFYLQGTTDPLVFTELSNNGTRQDFDFWFNGSQQQSWLISPLRAGGSDFLSTGQPLDVRVWGDASNGQSAVVLGEHIDYSVRLDRVLLGGAGADDINSSWANWGVAGYIDAGDGDDLVQGSTLAEIIVGGAGKDTLAGGDGNDSLDGGAGVDELRGEGGDDQLVVGGEMSPTDRLDGGSGWDTVVVTGDVNLNGVSLQNLEALRGSGTQRVTINATQLSAFQSASDVIFSGSSQNLSALAGNYTIEGTTGNDNLIGGDGDNTFRPFAGTNTISGGAGNDTVVWGNNLGGSNWDLSYRASYALSSTTSGHNFVIQGQFDGGTGTDTLSFNITSDLYDVLGYWSFWNDNPGFKYGIDLSQAQINSFERLQVISSDFTQNGITNTWGPSWVQMSATQLAALTQISGTRVEVVGGGNIDLNAIALEAGASVSVQGDAAVTWTGSAGDDSLTTFGGNDSLSGGAGNDTLSAGAGQDTVSGGAGDDLIIISGKSSVTDILDGGSGNDTLRITGADVDLSGAQLSAIEKLEANSASLALTQAQYDQFKATLTGTAGLILKMTSAGQADVAALPAGFVGIRGSSGNDVLLGGASADLLVGDAGNDSLVGGGGNDRLVAGAGSDTLRGGEGDDSFSVDGTLTVYAAFDGGNGVDRLVANDGLDLSRSSFTSVEQLTGSGTVTMSAAQLASFSVVNGPNIQLSDSAQALTLGSVALSATTTVYLSDYDIQLSGNKGVLGTAQDDVLAGAGGDDLLWGGRGADQINGGDGNDTLVGGSGTDTLHGGAGDDRFVVHASEMQGSSWQTITSDLIDGGLGTDTLSLDFSQSSWSTYQLVKGGIQNLEAIKTTGGGYSTLALGADQWRGLQSLTANNGDGYRYAWLSLSITGDGGALDLSAIDASSKLSQLRLTGHFASIDASSYTFGPTPDYNDPGRYAIYVETLDSIALSEGDDALHISNDSAFTVDAGAGNDRIYVNRISTASIDGGAGDDTLDVSQAGFIDLSGLTLSQVESIYQGNTTVLVTADQLANWSFDGSGAKFTKNGNTITGTAAADGYTGTGVETFAGGKGDDSISFVQTAVFNGRQNDYVFDLANRNGSLVIQQSNAGDMLDGTDTLNEVLFIRFGDTPAGQDIAIDDAFNDEWRMLSSASARNSTFEIQYGKAVSVTKEYSNDTDVFWTNLAPNSPLGVAASSDSGSGWSIQFLDVATQQQLHFYSQVLGDSYGTQWGYESWMQATDKWTPGFGSSYDGSFKPYQGGDVVMKVTLQGGANQEVAFTLNYLDDYRGSQATTGAMNAQVGVVRGYIGETDEANAAFDSDWVRTELVAGTAYRFELRGSDSGGGTLTDPYLELYNGNALRLAVGSAPTGQGAAAGADDVIEYTPTTSGTYYLAASDVAKIATGSWTLTQQSLDNVSDVPATTHRVEWTNHQFLLKGEINHLGDRDWYRIWLDKGITYELSALGASQGATLAQPQLSLRSITGNLLKTSGLSDVSLSYSASDSGWYLLDVGAAGNSGKGTFVVQGKTLADDFSDDAQTTGRLVQETVTHGLISYIGDSDWVKVGLSAGVTYVVSLSGDVSDQAQLDPLLDPLLLIRDGSGQVVGRFDDFGGSLNAKAYFTPSTSGAYFLEARSAFKYDIGAYALQVEQTPPDDVDASTPALTLGTASTYAIGIPGDRDRLAVDLVAGRVYQVSVNGHASHSGSLTNPFVRVFDAQGHLLGFNDDGGSGNDAQMFFVPTTSGRYFIEASAANDKGMGSYQVSVVQRDLPSDEAAGDVSTTQTLTAGQSFDGRLLTANDQDWFRINLSAGDDYVFRVRGASSGVGTLQDPVLDLYAANGTTLVKSFDNTLFGTEPASAFTATSSGVYYLAVRAADGQTDTGTYRLVTRGPDDHGNTKAQATHLSLNQVASGDLQWSDGIFGVRAWDAAGMTTDFDEDWFSFHANAGDVLSVQVVPGLGSMLSRPMVEVVDALGKSMAIGDGLETNNGQATATFKATASGALYARVIDGAGATGAYTISLTTGDASDEDHSGAPTLSFSALGASRVAQADARIGLSGDTDSFDVILEAGHSYRIETMPLRDGSTAPLSAASLALDWQLGGATTSQSIDVLGEALSPSAFASSGFFADTSGTMHITVRAGDSNQTGQYRLRVVDLGTNSADDRPDLISDALTATAITMNDNVSGRIDDADDVDLFAVSLASGNVYDLSVKGFADGLGTLAQSQLKLYNAAGQLLTVGEWDGVTGRSELALSVFDDGRYYLAVSATPANGNIGSYVLDTRLRETGTFTDDIAADTQSGARVAPGQPSAGTIDSDTDHDWFRLSLSAGQVYVLDVLAAGSGSGGSLQDAQMRLLDSDGNTIAWDDNSGAGADPHLQFTALSSGDYYVDVSSSDGSTGSYTTRLRELYSGLADPMIGAQWYLNASGLDALNGQFSGAGVKIGMIDDGINTYHPDLQAQINFGASYDAVGNTSDGRHKLPNPFEFHGTMVAGIMIAEANNETGIVGVAHDATVASIRVGWDWASITEALQRQSAFDISNNSWGAIQPFSDNFNSTALTFAWQGLREGVELGREGLGTVFVFSAGNSAAKGENTNYHNFQNAREVISVGAANADGSIASFSTPGANVLTSAFGVGMLTTNRVDSGLAFKEFSGTSAAAPLVSGVVALMLEANPDLGYRDVQDILVHASTHPSTQDWKANGATHTNLGGLLFNDQAGFGLINAANAVRLAQTWNTTLTAQNEQSASAREFGLNVAIPDGTDQAYTQTFRIEAGILVEHVELGVDLRHSRLGDLVIELTSPGGTVSTLMNRPSVTADLPFGLSGIDSGMPNHLIWDFSSVQFWGESAVGDWTIGIRDVRAEQTGTLQSLSLRVYGSADSGNDTYIFSDEGFITQTTRKLTDESGLDTINAAMLTSDVFIDLKPNGSISSNSVVYAIEPWSVIENAFAGIGNDRIDGNTQNNDLQGMAGDDVIDGGGGNDTINGGAGRDTVVFQGTRESYSDPIWNAGSKTITIVGPTGTSILSNVERLVFDNADINLSATVGNHAPIANSTWFDTPIFVQPGMGIAFDIPSTAFSDSDAGPEAPLALSIAGESGEDVPDWLTFDQDTGSLTGVPPENYQGQLKLLISATDEFGESSSDILTLQFGDNQAPVLEAPRDWVIAEDAGLRALGIALPIDPEDAGVISITIDELPTRGAVYAKSGETLKVGDIITADELTELAYLSLADDYGNMGNLRYTAIDADGVQAASSLRIVVTGVNDAPRFNVPNGSLSINYPLVNAAQLDFATPSDAESSITTVMVSDLPALGEVWLDGNQRVEVGQTLALSDLNKLSFTLSENVRGPIGSVAITATDSEGLSSTWTLALDITGDAVTNTGSIGADQLYGSIGADTIYGMAGDDLLVGNAGDDRLLGGLGNDSVYGGSGNDTLDGSSGNDVLDGGSGNDVMTGGPGADTYFVDSLGDMVLEVISGGAGGKDLVVTTISLTAPDNVEHLQASGEQPLNLTGNALDNALIGNLANNQLQGGDGRDSLFGGAGDDTLNGGNGVDKLIGGAGDDTYEVDSRFDAIQELNNEGIDSVWASSHYTLPSNVENLYLRDGGDWTAAGNSLDNHIIGNNGNNVLAGGLGADTLEGGLGDDTYVLNDRGDVLIDTGGNDTIRTSLDTTLPDGFENLVLVGITDAIGTGNGANNGLTGNIGDNILNGGAGVDTLTGAGGSDQFVIAKNAHGLAADQITDFVSGEDLIVVDLLSFGVDIVALGLPSSGTVAADSFVKSAGAKALDPNDYFIVDTAMGYLRFDADGNGSGAPVDVVKFVGTVDPALNGSDIYIAI